VLQKLTQNRIEVEGEGKHVRELIENLEKEFPGMKERICDDAGRLRRFINIYVNEEDIRFLEMDLTPLEQGDEVSIIPAVAGG
jgi:MoaD family protein